MAGILGHRNVIVYAMVAGAAFFALEVAFLHVLVAVPATVRVTALKPILLRRLRL